MRLFILFAIALTIGCATFYMLMSEPGANPSKPVLSSLFAGVFGPWVVMRLYFIARYGWHGAKSKTVFLEDS